MARSPSSSKPALPDAQVTAELLGRRLRDVRRKVGMTARSLAEASGVTPGFVSQVENGTAMPSVRTLLSMAEVLKVRPSQLFRPEERPARLVRVEDRRIYEYAARGFREAIISHDENEQLEVAWTIIQPGGGTGPELFTHGSLSESVIVLEGELHVFVDDDEYVLHGGDCLTFPGSSLHGCHNRSEEPAELFWITTPVVY